MKTVTAGSSQRAGITRDSKAALSGTEIVKPDAFSSSRPPSGHGIYQGSAANINGKYLIPNDSFADLLLKLGQCIPSYICGCF